MPRICALKSSTASPLAQYSHHLFMRTPHETVKMQAKLLDHISETLGPVPFQDNGGASCFTDFTSLCYYLCASSLCWSSDTEKCAEVVTILAAGPYVQDRGVKSLFASPTLFHHTMRLIQVRPTIPCPAAAILVVSFRCLLLERRSHLAKISSFIAQV